jgi:hypothetical protein
MLPLIYLGFLAAKTAFQQPRRSNRRSRASIQLDREEATTYAILIVVKTALKSSPKYIATRCHELPTP